MKKGFYMGTLLLAPACVFGEENIVRGEEMKVEEDYKVQVLKWLAVGSGVCLITGGVVVWRISTEASLIEVLVGGVMLLLGTYFLSYGIESLRYPEKEYYEGRADKLVKRWRSRAGRVQFADYYAGRADKMFMSEYMYERDPEIRSRHYYAGRADKKIGAEYMHAGEVEKVQYYAGREDKLVKEERLCAGAVKKVQYYEGGEVEKILRGS